MDSQKAAIDELLVHLSPEELEGINGVCMACKEPHLVRKGWYPDCKPVKCSKCGIAGCSNSVGKCDECGVIICNSCGLKWCEGTHDSCCDICWCKEHVPAPYEVGSTFDVQCSDCLPKLDQRGLNVKGD